MRFLSYQSVAGPRPGVLIDDELVLDIRDAAAVTDDRALHLGSVLAIVQGGAAALASIAALLERPLESALRQLDSLQLLAPLPVPEQIRDFANYEGHCNKAMAASMRLRAAHEADPGAALKRMQDSGAYRLPPIWYEIPLYYKGNRFATNGHKGVVEWPPFAENFDYEIELAAVIGKTAKNVSRDDARQHIFGYTIFNDFSARDIQARWEGQFRMGPAKGKDFDTGNSFGPWLVTRDEIPEPYDLQMIVRVNGEERARGTSGGSQHDFEACIAQVSRSETLHPGEILGLGTIENGCGFESLTWLEDGDVVELEIEGIGVLQNRVVRL